MPRLASLMVTLVLLQSSMVIATAGSLGRCVTEAQFSSYVGIIPRKPGLLKSPSHLNCFGSLGGTKQTPIAGLVAVGSKTTVDMKDKTLSFHLRWLKEFDVKNRVKGDLLMLIGSDSM